MKSLTKNAQPVFEALIIIALIAIIAVGVYKLVKNWTVPEEEPKQSTKIHSVIDKPSKELCSFMMKQCQGKY